VKALVFLLVIANVLLYALSAGLFGRPDNPDAGRIDQQIAVDRIKLVSRGEAPASKPSEAAADKTLESCLRWEQLSAMDADRLEALVKERFPTLASKRQVVAGEGTGWWVFIPPLISKSEAERKAGELRRFGVTDYFIVQDNSSQRFAISLGVFSSEKGGRDRLAELQEKGIKSARLAVRPGKENLFDIEIRGALPEKSLLTEPVTDLIPKSAASECK
jgi:hypothetical protein